jgi:hypothetical protein
VVEVKEQQEVQAQSPGEDAVSLHRWLVSFASGPEWYPVGEFVAVDAQAAIERAVDVFGAAADYRAEEIPWDAAPLVRPNPPARRPQC